METALSTVLELDENYGIKTLLDFVTGKETKEIKDFKFNQKPLFGAGQGKDETFWSSVFRQALLNDLLVKDIESYGLLKITDKGREFLEAPYSFKIPIDRNYEDKSSLDDGEPVGKTAVLDEALMSLLKDLRRREAKRLNVPPYVIFQDPSLEDMATQYPISLEDMTKVQGVSMGKATRYGKPFMKLIKEYVEENDIDRPTDFVVKQVANKSKIKVNIIQGIDRKLPLEDLASTNSLSMDELMEELDAIVVSGTKVNIDYYIDDKVDEYSREDIMDYFMEAKTDSIDDAYRSLKEDDITLEEIQLIRIKFLSDMAN